MSIVAVHGPYTFGSKGVQETGPVMGVVDPANGLKWDFKLDSTTTRPDQDFSWAFPTDGTPTPQLVADPSVVTYATPGQKTATLTVSNVSRTVSNKALTSNVATITTSATHGFKVGQSVVIAGVDTTFNGTYTIASTPSGTTFTYAKTAADVTSAASGGTVTSNSAQFPAAGSYPIVVTAATGAGAQTGLQSVEGGGEPPPEEGGEPSESGLGVGFDPAAHTVDEVKAYADEHPDDIEELLEAEAAGKNRSTLIAYLEERVPYDPGDYNVAEVVEYAEQYPDMIDDIIAAEQAGKNRSTLIAQLEALRDAE